MINENVLPQFDDRLSENAHSLAASLNPTLINKASERGEEIRRKLDAFVEGKKGIEYVSVLKRENDADMIVALNGSEDYRWNPHSAGTGKIDKWKRRRIK